MPQSGKKPTATNTVATREQNKTQNSTTQINPQGLMFLPDGKALIMDQDTYQNTIKNAIVIDLVENAKQSIQDEQQIDSSGSSSNEIQFDELKVSRNNHKDINRKPSQAT